MTPEQIKTLFKSWKEYCKSTLQIKEIMGGTANIMGDYSEILMAELYNAEKLPASSISADLKCSDGKLIQVKSRRVDLGKTTTKLGIIRHWDFDYLLVVLFYENGSLFKVLQMKSEDAKRYAVYNDYQKGYIITTNRTFLESPYAIDRTDDTKRLMSGSSRT